MTGELRPAVEVWRDAYDAYTDFYCHTTEKDPAAVIHAYGDEREAKGREEQAAEIERLTLTVRKLQGHQAALESYLREIRDKPVARSSDAWKRHCLKLQAIAAEALGDVA